MRNTFLLVVFVLILIAVYFLLVKNDKGDDASIKLEDRTFMLDDASEIDVFTIKNPGYPLMHFKRGKNDKWILNNQYYADPNVVSNMVGVLSSMEIKYIPPQSMMPKILKDLPRVGIEIKCFDENAELISDFIMGSNDIKESATFCINRGSDQAYAMHVTVAEGGLRNYFNQAQRDLRDKTLFEINPTQISEIKMTYFKDRKNSFSIRKNGSDYSFEALEPLYSKELDINNKTISSYLSDYKHVVAEAIRTGEVLSDSIQVLIPFARINYTLDDSTSGQFDFYPMIDLVVDSINTQTYRDLKNVERYFVFDNKGDVFIVQQRMLDSYFRPIEYFLN